MTLLSKIEELEKTIETLVAGKTGSDCDVKIVMIEEELISLSKPGYSCQTVGNNRWLMKKA